MTKKATKILEDLSLSMSSAEADDFTFQIKNKQYEEAKKILLEHINEQDAVTVIQHYEKISKNKVKLIEIEKEDVLLMESNRKYLVRVSHSIERSSLYNMNIQLNPQREDFVFVLKDGTYKIDQVDQIWLIEN